MAEHQHKLPVEVRLLDSFSDAMALLRLSHKLFQRILEMNDVDEIHAQALAALCVLKEIKPPEPETAEQPEHDT